MQFRVVGADQHRAVVGAVTYLCVCREIIVNTEWVLRWAACRNEVVLKDDCRTLNEAKNLCRAVAAEETLPHSKPPA